MNDSYRVWLGLAFFFVMMTSGKFGSWAAEKKKIRLAEWFEALFSTFSHLSMPSKWDFSMTCRPWKFQVFREAQAPGKKKDLPWNTSLRKHFCTSFVACSRNPTSAIQKHHRSSFLKSSRCKGPLNVCPLPKSPLNDVFISHLLQLNHLLIWGTHIGVCLSISIVKSQYIYTMNVDMTMCIHFFWPFHVCFLCSVLHFSHSAVWTAYTTCRPTCFYTG